MAGWKSTYSAGGLRLRPLRPRDAEAFFEAIAESTPDLCRWFHWCHAGYSRAEALAFTSSRPAVRESGEQFDFAVEAVSGRRLVGAVGVNRIDRPNAVANIGYWIRTGATGHGYATLALGLATRFGFDTLGLGRLEVLCAVDNRASIRVAEKSGFTREGTLRDRFVLGGSPRDAVLLSLLRSDRRPATRPARAQRDRRREGAEL